MPKIYVLALTDDKGSLNSIHGTTQDDTIADVWDSAGGVVYVTDSTAIPDRDPIAWRETED